LEKKARKEGSTWNIRQSENSIDEIRQSACHQQVRAHNEVVHELRKDALLDYCARAQVRLPALRA